MPDWDTPGLELPGHAFRLRCGKAKLQPAEAAGDVKANGARRGSRVDRGACGLENMVAIGEVRIDLQDSPSHSRQAPTGVRVLLVSDGRPGHYRQSEGVVAALARRHVVAVDRLDLAMRLPIPKGFIPKIARRLPPKRVLSLLHGLDASRLEKPDVIVSSGAATLGANVAFASLWGVPNVFSGSTRGFRLGDFSLVLTPYASVAQPPKVVAGPKPTPFDPDRVPPPRAFATAADLEGARISVLVGGPTPYADFAGEDWEALASLVASLIADWQCRVTLVTSPRTPALAYEKLSHLSARFGDTMTFVDYRSAGPGSIERAFDCDAILITSDSMSMMTEAAVSRRPALALAPRTVRPNKDDEAVAGLVTERWLAVLPLAALTAEELASAAASLQPMAENHLDRLASLLPALEKSR